MPRSPGRAGSRADQHSRPRDLQLPALDGIEATRRIRAAKQAGGTARLPIIAMTGNALEDDGEACEAAGMDAFVTKPVTLDQPRVVVRRTAARD